MRFPSHISTAGHVLSDSSEVEGVGVKAEEVLTRFRGIFFDVGPTYLSIACEDDGRSSTQISLQRVV